jgi:hypothetical protein
MKSPAKSAAQKAELAPDKRIITKIQAERLASLAKIDAKELIGHSIADLAEKLKWRIDPELFFFPAHLRARREEGSRHWRRLSRSLRHR